MCPLLNTNQVSPVKKIPNVHVFMCYSILAKLSDQLKDKESLSSACVSLTHCCFSHKKKKRKNIAHS